MTSKFAASEIAEMAIEIEINGRDFYNAVAAKVKSIKAKNLFQFLAGEEEKHIEKFKKILESVKKYEPKEAYPEEYFAHINALASNQVFTQKDKGAQVARGAKDENAAIAIGIKAEKDSITFYEDMKKIVPEEDKRIVDDVIAEEQKHLEELISLRGSL